MSVVYTMTQEITPYFHPPILFFSALLFTDLTLNLTSFLPVHQLLFYCTQHQRFHTTSSGESSFNDRNVIGGTAAGRKCTGSIRRVRSFPCYPGKENMGWHGWDCLQGWDLCPLVSHPSQLQLHRRMITFLAGASKSSLREAQKRTTAKGLTPNTNKEQHWALLWGVMDKEGRETGRQWCKNLIFPASWGDAGWWLHTSLD